MKNHSLCLPYYTQNQNQGNCLREHNWIKVVIKCLNLKFSLQSFQDHLQRSTFLSTSERVEMCCPSDPDASWSHSCGEASPTGRRAWGRCTPCWWNYVPHLAWECVEIPQEELEDMIGMKVVLTACCHYNLTQICGGKLMTVLGVKKHLFFVV